MLAYAIRGTVKDTEAFRGLAASLSARVEADEPGTRAYQWFLSASGEAMLWEQYADSEAFLTHFQNVQGDMKAIADALDITGVYSIGEASPAARAILDQLGAVYGEMVGGFSR